MSEIALLKKAYALFVMTGIAIVGISWLRSHKLGVISKLFLAGVLASFALIFDAYVLEPNWIQVTHVKIRDRALADVLGDTKLVHITDLHLNSGIGFRERQLVEKINKLKPDIIFVTGDIVDHRAQMKYAVDLFGQMKTGIGILGVPGDTDQLAMDTPSFRRELARANVDILVNERREIPLGNGRRLTVIGLDGTGMSQNFSLSLFGVPEGTPTIIIAPGPYVFDRAARAGANLLLVGDTHGGQIGIEWIVKMSDYAYRTDYIKGLFEKNKTTMYVNRGIGTKTRPVRFLCRPEIAVIEIEP